MTAENIANTDPFLRETLGKGGGSGRVQIKFLELQMPQHIEITQEAEQAMYASPRKRSLVHGR